MKLALMTVLALASAGCGSSTPSTNPDGSAPSAPVDAAATSDVGTADPAAIQAACESLWKATLARIARCGGSPYSSERATELESRYVQSCVNHGTARGSGYSATIIQSCATKTEGASCTLSADQLCDEPVGVLGTGDACRFPVQCASGRCVIATMTDTCGTCRATKADGDACQSGDYCAPGSECSSKVCTKVEYAASGGQCGSTTQRCLGGSQACGTDKKCFDLPSNEGDACKSYCAPGLVCELNGKCAKYSYVKVGEVCDDTHRCEKGGCTNGKCVSPSPDGTTCTNSTTCDMFATCVGGVGGSCQIPSATSCR